MEPEQTKHLKKKKLATFVLRKSLKNINLWFTTPNKKFGGRYMTLPFKKLPSKQETSSLLLSDDNF